VTIGTVINLASLTTPANVPKCVGNAFDPPATANFKDAAGKFVLRGYTPGANDVKFDDVPSRQCDCKRLKPLFEHQRSHFRLKLRSTALIPWRPVRFCSAHLSEKF